MKRKVVFTFAIVTLANVTLSGQLGIDDGGIRIGRSVLRLGCAGAGSPAVILEAGGGGGASAWRKVQPGITDLTRVCSYDRGEGRSGEEVIDDLHQLLTKAFEAGPYVLVGHSLGGLYVRRYASRFPDDVVGLVLVDSPDEKELTALIAPGASETGMVRFYRRIAEERREFMFGDKPLIVLSAGRSAPHPAFSPEQARQLGEDHRALQEKMCLLSRNCRQTIVTDAGHKIPIDRPDVVVAVIRSVISALRRGSKLPIKE